MVNEDTEMGEGQMNPDEREVIIAPAATSTAHLQPQGQVNDLSRLIMQQQQQINLLTQLAQLGGNSAVGSNASRSVQGPMPKGSFDRRYKGEGGSTLDEWISAAKRTRPLYSGMNEQYAVAWLAASLEGAALSWYESRFDDPNSPPASCAALFEELRKRFQPIDSEHTAMRELYALRQGAKQSVDEYATRFLHLLSKVPNLAVPFAIFQFRQGLHRSIDERINQVPTQPTALQETIALAARIEGRSAVSSNGDQVSNMESDASSAIMARLAAMEQTIAASHSREQRQPYDSRRGRGANKTYTPAWQHIPGMTRELMEKRRAANQCFYCGSGEHSVRDCADRVNKKPARLN